MKKTYTINLNGQVFSIDDDAYNQLHTYIETLEKHYLTEEDGKEIMADIESRIAELFQGFLLEFHKEVISQPEIDKVIEIMGTPDAIIDEDTPEPGASTPKKRRKLFRDPEEAILGGVAAGLAAYFSLSVSLVRILFIILAFFYGITFIVYIILWIVLPQALTSKQKLEMKGENINVSNIEKNIRNTYNDVKKNSAVQQAGKKVANLFSCIGEIIRKTFQVISYFLVTVVLLICSFSFFTLCLSFLFSIRILPDHYYLLLEYLSAPIPLWFLQIIVFCFIAIPLFLIIYYSISYLCKFPTRKKMLIISGCIWISSASLVLILGSYYTLAHVSSYQEKKETVKLPADTARQVINIWFNKSVEAHHLISTGLDYHMFYSPQIKDTLFLYPYFSFKQTTKSSPELIIRKKARGITANKALQNVNNIRYTYQLRNDTLYLADSFTLAKSEIRDHDLRIDLYIPEGYRVNLSNPLPFQFLNENFRDKSISNFPEHQSFVMHDGKLEKISEQPDSSSSSPRQMK